MDKKIKEDIFTKIKKFNSNIKIEYGNTIRAPNKKKTDKTDRYFFSYNSYKYNKKNKNLLFQIFDGVALELNPLLEYYIVITELLDSYSGGHSQLTKEKTPYDYEYFETQIKDKSPYFKMEQEDFISHIFKVIDDDGNESLDEVQKFLNGIEQTSNKPMESDEEEKMSSKKENSEYKLLSVNTILYGPPGTGKTYNSVKYAVGTIDDKYSQDGTKTYTDYVNRFNELKAVGQIAFTTFHQSYGYEEFIEGIKPSLNQDTDNEGSEDVLYTLNDGVFKEFCLRAQEVVVDKELTGISPDAQIWKVSVSDTVKDDCFESNRVRINFSLGDRSKSVEYFNHSIKKGDIVLMTPQSRTLVTGIGIVIDEEAYEIKENTGITARNVEWLARDISIDIKDYSNGKQMVRNTVSRVHIVTVKDILTIIKNNSEIYKNVDIPQKNDKKYVFIIDEINRGNISKIFGELITLIEDSKRDGEKEAISITLPYSKEEFSVPKNVYILGTMNTADRSIALMDTALRRRFEFIEMMPNEELLTDIVIDGIEVKKMLETMNRRIEALYDREHTLGHAFFMPLKNEKKATINQLASIFKNKIIPLLQEYFYEDYEKIMLVLGIDPQNTDASKFISVKSNDELFKNSPDIDLNPTYQINEKAFQTPDNYMTIYGGASNSGEADETKDSDS